MGGGGKFGLVVFFWGGGATHLALSHRFFLWGCSFFGWCFLCFVFLICYEHNWQCLPFLSFACHSISFCFFLLNDTHMVCQRQQQLVSWWRPSTSSGKPFGRQRPLHHVGIVFGASQRDGGGVGTTSTQRREDDRCHQQRHLEFDMVAEPSSITTWQLGNDGSESVQDNWATTSEAGSTQLRTTPRWPLGRPPRGRNWAPTSVQLQIVCGSTLFISSSMQHAAKTTEASTLVVIVAVVVVVAAAVAAASPAATTTATTPKRFRGR